MSDKKIIVLRLAAGSCTGCGAQNTLIDKKSLLCLHCCGLKLNLATRKEGLAHADNTSQPCRTL